jgi:hypothetical protein
VGTPHSGFLDRAAQATPLLGDGCASHPHFWGLPQPLRGGGVMDLFFCFQILVIFNENKKYTFIFYNTWHLL